MDSGPPSITPGQVMLGFPPPAEARPPAEGWDMPPWNTWTFRNIRRMFPTAPIRRSEKPWVFKESLVPLDSVTFENHKGEITTLDHHLAETNTNAIVVLHKGKLVFERYRQGMTAHDLHLSQSVSKSFIAALAGIVIAEGTLDPQQPLGDLIPELEGRAYGAATVRHVMDMASGVIFDESYENLESDVRRIDRAFGWLPRRPGDSQSIYEVAASLTESHPHGNRFDYRSIETDVLAWAIERAAGRHLTELMRDKLWQPTGMEDDGLYCVDGAGSCFADGGLNATIRDYARFGQLHLQDGARGRKQILPASFLDEIRDADPSLFGAPYNQTMPYGAYRNQMWVCHHVRGDYEARGIFGQRIWIDKETQTVVARFGAWPRPLVPHFTVDTHKSCRAIAAYLKAEA